MTLNELNRSRDQVSSLPALQGTDHSIVVDPVSRKVILELNSRDEAKLQGVQLPSSDRLTVRHSAGFGTTSTVYGDRNSDYAPFQAGGIVNPSGCTLGPRVRLNGQEMLLTAGHCGAASVYTSGSGTNLVIGWRYTTSWPGNADIYGDWQLLYGRDYSDWVFNGAPFNDTSSLRGTGLNLGWRATGTFLCSTGMTTGQWCRQRILYNDSSYTASGVTVRKLYQTTLDNNDPLTYGRCLYTGQNGKAPDGYDRGGDSGGAAYHSNGTTPNTVTYDGLTSGMSWTHSNPVDPTWYCRYFYTSLIGVKAYAPTIGW